MKCPFVIKVCNKCNSILVANAFNFNKKSKGKYGVAAVCKTCYLKNCKEYRDENKEKINKKQRERYNENIEKERQRSRDKYIKTKDKHNAYSKKYYEEHREYLLQKSHEHYMQNQEKYKERHNEYYYEHVEYYNEYRRQWRENNPDKAFNSSHKRRLQKEQQGNGITLEQWIECMEFFDWRCAYSGEYIGGKTNKRTLDHIIPLNNNGEHEIWNLVPMLRNYNSSKHDKNMEEWYSLQEYYDENRLNKIYQWIEYAKNKWKE